MTHHDARAEMKRPEQHGHEDALLEPHDHSGGQDHGEDQGQRHGEHSAQGHQMQGMAEMAEQVTRHYDTPTPHSRWPSPDPFPPAVMRGLALGTALGAVAGALVGYLLAQNILVVPGWELMYSGAPATIYTLWTFLGAALGVATVGVGTLLAAPLAVPQGQPEDEQQPSAPPAQRERTVGER